MPADVWGYPTRTLTERFAIIERVPPRYDSSLTLVFRGKRVIKGGTRFIGVSNDVIVVGVEDNELIRSATETILLPSFDPANMKDSNDDTYSSATVPGTGGLEYVQRDFVKYDVGSVRNMCILLIVQSTSTAMYCLLDVSNDDRTYTNILAFNGTTKTTYMLLTSARYIKLWGRNYATGSNACWFYTLEAYDVEADITVTGTGVRTLTIISRGYSQVLEVIQL
jgi:hypothetical protein